MPVRILIADDHQPVLKATRAILETHPGWEVCAEATDGEEAVRKALDFRPDVIILDLCMPRMHGLQAADEICALLPTVPILLHTLYASQYLDLEAGKHGIQASVEKGKSEALIAAIERVLSREVNPDADPPGISTRAQTLTPVGCDTDSGGAPAAIDSVPSNVESSQHDAGTGPVAPDG